MKDCSLHRALSALTHDVLDLAVALRPLPPIQLDRVAENEAKYSPHAEFDDEVQRFRDLMERSTESDG